MIRLETARHHAQETYDKDLVTVQDLELKLGINSHWKPGDVEWQNAGCLMAQQKYQHALNNLESLVVARIFELGKMNQAGTGKLLQCWQGQFDYWSIESSQYGVKVG